MTAQNMGKKILTDAGYDVIAVSNGAAAVKKIAEHKPDIIILDVYMPGYTGLEVCEKVRASIDTLKTPVLLTVGKLEPYRAEDANRVKADGVIIKPFEASDLIAIVKKLEGRVVHKSDPVGDQTILLDRPPDFSQFTPGRAEAPVGQGPTAVPHAEEQHENTMQATVDVPDHMAMAAAFSDLLGTEPAHSMEPFQASNSNHAEFDVTAETPLVETPSAFSVGPQVEAAPTAAEFHSVSDSALKISLVHSSGPVELEAAEETMIMPAYKEPQPDHAMAAAAEVPVQHDPSFEPTIPEEAVEVVSATDPELQPSFQEQGKAEINAAADPGLMMESSALQSFPTKFGVEHAEEVPVGIASDLPDFGLVSSGPETAAIHAEDEVQHSTAHQGTPATEVSEDDFDARVAAALAAYEQAAELQDPVPQATSQETEMPVSFEYVPSVSTPKQETAVAQAELPQEAPSEHQAPVQEAEQVSS